MQKIRTVKKKICGNSSSIPLKSLSHCGSESSSHVSFLQQNPLASTEDAKSTDFPLHFYRAVKPFNKNNSKCSMITLVFPQCATLRFIKLSCRFYIKVYKQFSWNKKVLHRINLTLPRRRKKIELIRKLNHKCLYVVVTLGT